MLWLIYLVIGWLIAGLVEKHVDTSHEWRYWDFDNTDFILVMLFWPIVIVVAGLRKSSSITIKFLNNRIKHGKEI